MLAKSRTSTVQDRLLSEEGGRVALTGFFRIMQRWKVSPEHACVLLGSIPKSTFYAYKKNPSVKLDHDKLERVSYVLGIYKALVILLGSETLACAWIKRPNTDAPFGGRSALEFMLTGSVTALAEIRRYLDYHRGAEG